MENPYSLADIRAALGNCKNDDDRLLLFALIFGGGFGGYGFGGRGMGCGQGLQGAEIMGQLNSLRDRIDANQNANALGAGIAANHEGQHSIMDRMASCCCDNKLLSTQMGYENRLGQKDLQGAMLMGFDRTNTGLERGFSSVAYESQKQTCDIINAGNANTQRIIDTLNSHWNQDLQQRYNDARLELSQQRQNATIIDAIREAAG